VTRGHSAVTVIRGKINGLRDGPSIALGAGMRTLALLIALTVMPSLTAHAQQTDPPEGATISAAQLSGLDLARLSPGLQEQIGRLAGTPLIREHLRELAARIEAEQPRYVAAVRAVQDPDGEVRVTFVVARIRGDRDREANINARYIVERVEIRGVPDTAINQELRADVQALAGRRLDSDEAERLEARLREALPEYDVRRMTIRGNQPGEIRLVYAFSKNEASRWLHFEPGKSKFVYHSDQGWGGLLDLPIGSRDIRFTPTVAIDNGDDLIEEYSGFGLRFEARKLGTERLGASLEWTTFDQTWQPTTLTALELNPRIPEAYDDRSTVTPLVTVALTRQLRVSGGVSISELEPLSGLPESEMANAAIASIGYDQQWKHASGSSHDLEAAFVVRAASETLESDLVYTRYFGQGGYWFQWAKQRVLVTGMAGSISGNAPLFERFSLGDSQTLRGWNKYDIAPAGGDRMFHTSVEYQYRGLAVFLDTGSVWDRDTDGRVRVATGVGFHPGPVFFTVGFPLNTDELSAVFTMGIRFSGVGMRKY
jgi:hypothetical protein